MKPATIKPELDPKDIQVLANSLDSHVRRHGSQVLIETAVVLQKLQAVAAASAEAESGPQTEPPGDV